MGTLVIRGQRVLLPTGVAPACIEIDGGKITGVFGLDHPVADSAQRVDAGDQLVSPGVVDTHVHINEPGRTEWEGFASATQAAAAGGITTVVDMPLNCIPATTSRRAAEQKREALAAQLHVDVAFWGGVVPGNTAQLAELAAFGVAGCKCFLCPSGVDEFPNVTAADLDLALPVMRELGLTLLVHAELPGPLADAEAAVAGLDPTAYDTYLRSRPPSAEDQAVAMVIALARKHRARVHIVHLSSASAVPLIAQAQADGVPITAETCLHYLTFCSEDIAAGQTHFKCAPPIRPRANQQALWAALQGGTLDMVVSDHSPCTPQLKKPQTGDFMGAWGGISGLQLGLSALWTQARQRGLGVEQVFAWNAFHTARLAHLETRKGRLAVGYDADLVVWDDQDSFTVEPQHIMHRHKVTPYAGMRLDGVVHQTYVGGVRVYSKAGGLNARPSGRFVEIHP